MCQRNELHNSMWENQVKFYQDVYFQNLDDEINQSWTRNSHSFRQIIPYVFVRLKYTKGIIHNRKWQILSYRVTRCHENVWEIIHEISCHALKSHSSDMRFADWKNLGFSILSRKYSGRCRPLTRSSSFKVNIFLTVLFCMFIKAYSR